ncbi:protein B4 [Dryobates pubescens]|uniref:protein B4 n=1 Tax=Dryobates pubescens TaxID=118200 RepID=UPI0023B942AC|nr:protein B4 [Dryobates pubescens]
MCFQLPGGKSGCFEVPPALPAALSLASSRAGVSEQGWVRGRAPLARRQGSIRRSAAGICCGHGERQIAIVAALRRRSEAAGPAQVPTQLARGRRPLHPPTLHMVIEALKAQGQDQKKGVSVVAIKRFILSKYPAVDPIRLKYLLKQALHKGLSRGDLVRPHNSSAMGATGRFKLAPKKPQKQQPPGQADPDRGQAPKPGGKGTSKTLWAPTAGEQQQGSKQQQPVAVKKAKAKLVDAKPPAARKPRSSAAKPPKAAGHAGAPGESRPRPPAAAAAKDTGRGQHTAPDGAAAAQPRRAPAGQSKGKAPKAAQKEAPKAKGGPDRVRKPRVTPGAGKGEKADSKAAGRKAP